MSSLKWDEQGIITKNIREVAEAQEPRGRQPDPAPVSTCCWGLFISSEAVSGSQEGLNTLQEFGIISEALSQAIPIILKLLLPPTSVLTGKPQSLCRASGMRCL